MQLRNLKYDVIVRVLNPEFQFTRHLYVWTWHIPAIYCNNLAEAIGMTSNMMAMTSGRFSLVDVILSEGISSKTSPWQPNQIS